jgi:uncharacterized protein (DUF1778 family)
MQANSDTPQNTRSARLEARISHEQKTLFQQAALLSTRTLSEFVVASAQEAARRIIDEHENLRLTREEQLRFVNALLKPPAPSKRLRQAAAQYRATSGL